MSLEESCYQDNKLCTEECWRMALCMYVCMKWLIRTVVFQSGQFKHTCTLWSKAIHKVESYHNQPLNHMIPTTHTGEGGGREVREGGREVKRRLKEENACTLYLCWTVSRSSFSMSGASWYTSRTVPVEGSIVMRYNSYPHYWEWGQLDFGLGMRSAWLWTGNEVSLTLDWEWGQLDFGLGMRLATSYIQILYMQVCVWNSTDLASTWRQLSDLHPCSI